MARKSHFLYSQLVAYLFYYSGIKTHGTGVVFLAAFAVTRQINGHTTVIFTERSYVFLPGWIITPQSVNKQDCLFSLAFIGIGYSYAVRQFQIAGIKRVGQIRHPAHRWRLGQGTADIDQQHEYSERVQYSTHVVSV